MITFGQQLQSLQFDHYVATLEHLTQRVGSFEQWYQTQTAVWQETCRTLGVSVTPTSAAFGAVLENRLNRLETIVRDCFGDLVWEQWLTYIRQAIAPEFRHGYFIKPERLRRDLERHPPVQTLQYLGYGTVADYCAHESLMELLAALRFSESTDWMNAHLQLYHDLQPTDFEYREVQFLLLAPGRWWALAKDFAKKKKHHFSHLKEAGVIFWYPSPDTLARPPLHVMILLLLHYVFEVHFYATWFEQQLLRLNRIGEYFVQTLGGDVQLCGQDDRHVPIIQQYHLKNPQPHRCVFEPHVMSEALHWQKAATIFFNIIRSHPHFSDVAFWEKCYTVGQWQHDHFMTFNIMDNVVSAHEPLDYHFREDVWNAILASYTSLEQVEQLMMDNFSTKQIDLNVLKIAV